ncbi:class I SAM-dependent methyltransferase [Streptomyces sp. NPDC059063]|uniref:class I SAM-dependent methyltransferase n=1 Tax=unclassified Streptomyces TaxID=2593676 RepID=UPI0036C73C5F
MNDWTSSHDRTLAQRNADGWSFLIEAARDLRTTGAVAPSGRALARMLADPLRGAAGRPLTVLEAGAGTGSVTRALIPLLSSGSRLDIVEANPRFAARLRTLTRTDPLLAGAAERVRVHEGAVESLETGRRYDVIVSGLPFTNFAPEHVELIMERYLDLLHPGGTLTYFAYRGTRTARSLLSSRVSAGRHRAVERVLAGYQRRYATGRWTVWGNLPPAYVWQLRVPTADASAATPAAVPQEVLR